MTSDNRKRSAGQQYYHVNVELWADIRNPLDKSTTWVKVAQLRSAAVVVRARSPSHYQNEGRQSAALVVKLVGVAPVDLDFTRLAMVEGLGDGGGKEGAWRGASRHAYQHS